MKLDKDFDRTVSTLTEDDNAHENYLKKETTDGQQTEKYMVGVVNTNSDTDTGCSTAIFKLQDTTHDNIGEQAVSDMNAQSDEEAMQIVDENNIDTHEQPCGILEVPDASRNSQGGCEPGTGVIEKKDGGIDSKI